MLVQTGLETEVAAPGNVTRCCTSHDDCLILYFGQNGLQVLGYKEGHKSAMLQSEVLVYSVNGLWVVVWKPFRVQARGSQGTWL